MRWSAASAGWHVHYVVNGHVHVQLACNRKAAINIARALLNEDREVLRLIRFDARKTVSAEAIRKLCDQAATLSNQSAHSAETTSNPQLVASPK
jgi:hypothetical protein